MLNDCKRRGSSCKGNSLTTCTVAICSAHIQLADTYMPWPYLPSMVYQSIQTRSLQRLVVGLLIQIPQEQSMLSTTTLVSFSQQLQKTLRDKKFNWEEQPRHGHKESASCFRVVAMVQCAVGYALCGIKDECQALNVMKILYDRFRVIAFI